MNLAMFNGPAALWRRLAAVFCVFFACITIAEGQLAVPSSHSGASITQPTSSILLTPADQTALRNWWNSPTTPYQAAIKNRVNNTANESISFAAPTNLNTCQVQASLVEAKALRWLLTGNGNTSSQDYIDVKNVLTNYAKVTGTSGITGPLIGAGYFSAFDFINAGLSPTERSAITTRLTGNVLGNLGSVYATNNQSFINYGGRAYYALLAGNESNLDTAMGNLQSKAYSKVTTNDGFMSDGDRYFNFTLGTMPNFLVAYKNSSGDAVGVAQYVQAAEQQARYALGIRMPNGLSPSFHNSDNAPIAIHELSRMVANPALKAATVWYAEQLQGYDWFSTTSLNDDWTYSDYLWTVDYSAGVAAPNWSPTYFSGGQAKISVFKNDWGTNCNYLATTAGIDGNASSFVHSDTGAITLAANGAQILVEPGYARSIGDSAMPNTPPHSGGTNLNTTLAIEHNVLLARNTGTSTWGVGNNGDNATQTTTDISIANRLDSTERGNFKGVADFSTLRANYTGGSAGANVQMRRSTAMINENGSDLGYFVMADSFRRTDTTNKDFAINLIGKSVAANTQIMADTATYKKICWSVDDYFGVTYNNAKIAGPPYDGPTSGQVIAHVVSSRPMDAVAQDQTWMVENWGVFVQTQRMRVSTTQTDRGAFLTFFETGPANFASRWTVTPMSGTDYAAARVASTDGWTDWHISQTSATDVHSATPGAQVSIDSGAIASDAQYAYLRRVGSKLDSAMISGGTNLYSAGSQIFGTDHAVTASMLFSDMEKGELLGTVSMDGFTDNTSFTFFSLGSPITGVSYNGLPLSSFTANSVTLPYISNAQSVPFAITYATPEPSSLLLLGSALVMILFRGYLFLRGR